MRQLIQQQQSLRQQVGYDAQLVSGNGCCCRPTVATFNNVQEPVAVVIPLLMPPVTVRVCNVRQGCSLGLDVTVSRCSVCKMCMYNYSKVLICHIQQVTKIYIAVVNRRLLTMMTIIVTRHRVSTSIYLLTFCIRIMLPERHQWKPAVQAAAVMLRSSPVDGQSPASQPRPLPIYAILRMPPVTRQSPASSARRPRRAFTLCRHITGWTQAYNQGSRYVAIATQRVHRLQIRPIVPSKYYFVGTK